MIMALNDINTLLSFLAIIVSSISLYVARINWRQSNRPIVTAFVAEDITGSTGATFTLIVSNTGNRPAVSVRLIATESEIAQLLKPGVAPNISKEIASIFSKKSEIPLLRNGEEISTPFGSCTCDSKDEWLRYGAEITIAVSYSDIDGRKYNSKSLPLKVYFRNGFGGRYRVVTKND
jgi:hypothetical protein